MEPGAVMILKTSLYSWRLCSLEDALQFQRVFERGERGFPGMILN